jgi:hypothetical protein
MVRSRRSGLVLWEIVAALFIVTLVSLSAAALLRAQGRDVRMLYEERVAWEIATGHLARLEASGAPVAGSAELPVEGPGSENLLQPQGRVTTAPAEGKLRKVTVEVSWTGEKGVRRRVEARALVEVRP